MNLIDCPSLNCDSRENHAVDMLVLHYTGMPTGQQALHRLCDEASKVSAHYLVEENGDTYLLVPEHARAWHAGASYWRGHTNINQRSIGIEIVNPGHEFGYRPFPDAQMQSVITLCKDILSRHSIPARNVVGHADIAPARKEDPGELFDWKKLADEGIGLFPDCHSDRAKRAEESSRSLDYARDDIEKKLATYGYDISDLPKAITAFQRHFRPALLNGQWDEACGQRLAGLLERV